MRYQYFNKEGRLLAESDSPITFNSKLFPTWAMIVPTILESGPQPKKEAPIVEKEIEIEKTDSKSESDKPPRKTFKKSGAKFGEDDK